MQEGKQRALHIYSDIHSKIVQSVNKTTMKRKKGCSQNELSQ